MWDGALCRVRASPSLPLPPPHPSPCSSPGPSPGLPGNPCPSGVSPGAAWSPSSPPPALPSGLAGLFLTRFPSALAAGQRFALSEPGFPRGARPWLRGSAVPCGGAVGAGWNRLCPARGSPGPAPQGPPHTARPHNRGARRRDIPLCLQRTGGRRIQRWRNENRRSLAKRKEALERTPWWSRSTLKASRLEKRNSMRMQERQRGVVMD
ncbi:PREDICTED: U1 small nuclear ribonucleoprotein C-like isoform X1 [Calidris pugnax]|uniref:U1 small nuclear ribonucleoprotein C-like isoform X1 n=1 Tax=Calidris pugnax TaxID=198806 RepID=UPI00071C9F91|nr:PREDICTED: U1 small nuclear ribonucleoprotein C-like isoform X1 [Calidris pugnax]XP_014796321.1 PREDICTED: U1 small nuclear ribonucleoprotein C-like isoform X1 [Calidris pugnax]XP_014796322.1 PREDICTED: U1 small nuclear ribonucleoprotein C-like isoform X1 [Calidris pugnax]XP_014796323.1 PREDICTED: U1 small nuclear ribonucleoprotein C-like isoform X1 [Calidris pugnax]XP_014796324.1 PREDICTED: U1 small nuclear ribonucleoprotein C-like isoform X1 [Calidris pugnax]XP_014796325.1 PREDICTED: U1 s